MRFVISNAKIIPNDEVTNCGQLDTKSMVFTIFGGNWNKEKNKEYPPKSTPAFTKAATIISKSFGLCCNQWATNTYAVVPRAVIKMNGGNGNMPCKCATTGAIQAITRPFFHP